MNEASEMKLKQLIKQTAEKGKAITICVLGAGHGGMAMAGHLAIMGFPVRLFNRTDEKLNAVRWHGGIRVEGEIEGFGKIDKATANIEEAITGADVLMVVTPSTAHKDIAELCAPYLKAGQIIVLNPGRTGGALEFNKTLKDKKAEELIIVSETQTFIYASRAVSGSEANIFRIENTRGRFEYYLDGVTPSVAKILEAIDKERVAVAEKLGIRLLSAREWLYLTYDAPGKNLYEAIQESSGYKGINAPSNINHRYIFEDVPMSLVPLYSIGQMLGINMPTIKSIIDFACIMHDKDYFKIGRTVESLGLSGMSVKDIRQLVVGIETIK